MHHDVSLERAEPLAPGASRTWRRMALTALLSTTALGAILAGGSAAMAGSGEVVPAGQGLSKVCPSLVHLRGSVATDPSLTITSAHLVPEGSAVEARMSAYPGRSVVVPAHCEVAGSLRERVGANGQRYAVKFHMRLPLQWNGRFIFQGGGGSNGDLGTALAITGYSQPAGLARGYAVVSQDAGHDNALNVDDKLQGQVTFGHDFQGRRDYAYASHEVVTRVAKDVIRTAYGSAPAYSYFVGCSKGGQEGMMMAQRYPTYFNGILSTAPGFTLPKASAIGESWDSQAMAAVATSFNQFDSAGVPLLNKAFSDKDLAIVSQAVTTSCDDFDGVRDGMVQDFRRCTTAQVSKALSEVTCAAAKTDACITPAQVAGLKRLFDGAHNAKAELLYASWPWDAGIGGKNASGSYYQGWRDWKLGPYDSAVNSAINVTLGAAAASAVFTTPPTKIPMDASALTRWALAFDFEADAPKIFHSNADYAESGWDTMSADSTDRSQFRDHGGKLLAVHGVSDPIFSINDTIRWLMALDKVENGRASNYVRLFAVPGMAHCSGGPATDDYDAFQALVNWVEKNQPPERILARAGPNTPWPGRTRPLCSFPKKAVYNGTGDIEDAANFSCK